MNRDDVRFKSIEEMKEELNRLVSVEPGQLHWVDYTEEIQREFNRKTARALLEEEKPTAFPLGWDESESSGV